MVWRGVFAIFAVVGVCQATINPSAKQASAICIKNEQMDTITMTFKLDLNSDPQGYVRPLDDKEYEKNPKEFSPLANCNAVYSTVTKIYTITSVIDLSPVTNDNKNSNLCGMFQGSSVSGTTYEWLFMHQIKGTVSAFSKTIEDMDRVYEVKCDSAAIVSNKISTASITVSTPNLNQVVTPKGVSALLQVYRKNADSSYTLVTNSMTLPVNTIVRLQVTYDRGNNYIPGVNVFGIYTYETEVGSSSAFIQNDFLVQQNGCANPSSNSNSPPFTTTKGFKRVVQTANNLFVAVTGDFRIWKYDPTNTLYFQTYFGVCYEGSTAKCVDMCLAQTNVQERKRRDTETGEVLTTFVRVEGDAEERTAAASKYMQASIIIGTVVGTVLVVVVALLICVCITLRRRRTVVGKHRQFDNVSSTSSFPPVVPVEKI